MNNQKAFTLLELIVVIIIIGILASVAMPRLFKMIEYSKSAEAMLALSTLARSADRCFLVKGIDPTDPNADFDQCDSWAALDVEDPGAAPHAHFTYMLEGSIGSYYYIEATRTTFDGGDGTSKIYLYLYDPSGTGPGFRGTGTYQNLRRDW